MNLEDVSNSADFLQISEFLEKLFDENSPQKPSMEPLFIVRKTGQLGGRMFLILNTIELVNYPKNSLQDQYFWLKEYFEVEFKKESLDEHFDTHSVSFLKSCFENLLNQPFIKEKPQGLCTTFNRILLRDSSTWQLPSS